MNNFFKAGITTRNKGSDSKTTRQQGIIAVYKGNSFYAKINNKLYLIENYKLTSGVVYSKPCNDAYLAWSRKDFTKELNVDLTIDNYLKIEKIWASLYDGQIITGTIVPGGFFHLISKTDKLL